MLERHLSRLPMHLAGCIHHSRLNHVRLLSMMVRREGLEVLNGDLLSHSLKGGPFLLGLVAALAPHLRSGAQNPCPACGQPRPAQ